MCEGGEGGRGREGGANRPFSQTERVSDSGAFNSEEQIVGCVCRARVGGHDDCAFMRLPLNISGTFVFALKIVFALRMESLEEPIQRKVIGDRRAESAVFGLRFCFAGRGAFRRAAAAAAAAAGVRLLESTHSE